MRIAIEPLARRLVAFVASGLLAAGCSPILYGIHVFRESMNPDRTLALAQPATGSTDVPDRRFHLSCEGRNEVDADTMADHVYRFVPPASGRYRLRVAGQYDTVLGVFRADDDSEIACNDDSGGTDSEIIVPLDARQNYFVVVSGFRGDHGRYSLAAEVAPPALSPIRAPSEDLGTTVRRCRTPPRLTLGLATGLFVAAPGALAACGGRGIGGVYQLDLDSPGMLRISQVSPFGAAMELRRVCNSGASAIACVRHPSDAHHATLSSRVEAGSYYVVIDSTTDDGRGPFALDVQLDRDEQPSSPVVVPVASVPAPAIAVDAGSLRR